MSHEQKDKQREKNKTKMAQCGMSAAMLESVCTVSTTHSWYVSNHNFLKENHNLLATNPTHNSCDRQWEISISVFTRTGEISVYYSE